MKPRVIACAIDFSPPARVALEEAVALAIDADARLLLIHVAPSLIPPEVALPPEIVEGATEATKARLGEWLTDARLLGAKQVQSQLVNGAPWERICAVAAELDVDLIVVGTHGRTGLRHVVLGSVAEKVARHAPCAVLIARRRPA